MSEAIGIILSFTGIILAVGSIVLTHITFFAPGYWIKIILRSPGRWLRIAANDEEVHLLRHEIFSGFTIRVDFNKPCVERFYEPWLDSLYRPDTHNTSSYNVILELNGLPFLSELFVSYDGGRNFIPAPKMKPIGGRYYLYFDDIQRLLAPIVGFLYSDETFEGTFSRIIGSVYNPVPIGAGALHPNASIKELDRKIMEFKARSSILNAAPE